MRSPAFDIATVLQDGGFGTIGVNIFTTEDQDSSPDSIIIVKDTGTVWPDGTRQDMEYPALQIVCRDRRGAGQACEEKIRNIKNYLKTITRYTVNGSYIVYIDQANGPTEIGVDATMRPLYSLNMSCLRQYEYN